MPVRSEINPQTGEVTGKWLSGKALDNAIRKVDEQRGPSSSLSTQREIVDLMKKPDTKRRASRKKY